MTWHLFLLFFFVFPLCSYGGMKDVQERLYSMSAKEELMPHRHEEWMEEYDKAAQIAQQEGKLLLIAALGTPWCPWSEKMETDVLNDPSFVSQVRLDYVMVAHTLAEGAPPPEWIGAVEELPTLIVARPSGEVITRMGFLPKDPQAFAQHLSQIKRDFFEVCHVVEREDLTMFSPKELKRLYLKAKTHGFGAMKERLFLAGLRVDPGLFFLLEHYAILAEKGKVGSSEGEAVRKKICKRDPKNEQGALRSLALVDFHTLSQAHSIKNKHIKAALRPLVSYVKKFGTEDPENLWRMELLISQFLYSRSKAKEALLHAKAAHTHAPKEHQAEIVDTITYLENKVKKR